MAWIFVNPTQFENADDLDAYPRNTERDLELLRTEGVDAVFLPEVSDIYPDGAETFVECTKLGNMLHGAVRPGHYRGVTTVVTKFFNIIQPDAAMFGEKDYQQLQVIKRMVRDLHMPIRIVGVPTVREEDGLAMSSRNVRLGAEDRAAAVILSQSLNRAQELARAGTTIEGMRAAISETIGSESRATLKGLDIVHPDSLGDLSGPVTAATAIMISVEIGGVLLIDQKVVTP
jgi:pantoate--beta-alanine ligase